MSGTPQHSEAMPEDVQHMPWKKLCTLAKSQFSEEELTMISPETLRHMMDLFSFSDSDRQAVETEWKSQRRLRNNELWMQSRERQVVQLHRPLTAASSLVNLKGRHIHFSHSDLSKSKTASSLHGDNCSQTNSPARTKERAAVDAAIDRTTKRRASSGTREWTGVKGSPRTKPHPLKSNPFREICDHVSNGEMDTFSVAKNDVSVPVFRKDAGYTRSTSPPLCNLESKEYPSAVASIRAQEMYKLRSSEMNLRTPPIPPPRRPATAYPSARIHHPQQTPQRVDFNSSILLESSSNIVQAVPYKGVIRRRGVGPERHNIGSSDPNGMNCRELVCTSNPQKGRYASQGKLNKKLKVGNPETCFQEIQRQPSMSRSLLTNKLHLNKGPALRPRDTLVHLSEFFADRDRNHRCHTGIRIFPTPLPAGIIP